MIYYIIASYIINIILIKIVNRTKINGDVDDESLFIILLVWLLSPIMVWFIAILCSIAIIIYLFKFVDSKPFFYILRKLFT